MDQSKAKVTLYMRPELHKALKLRSVQEEMKMSELAEQILERYLLEFAADKPLVCPHCQSEIVPSKRVLAAGGV
ncbi:MAG TPA: hypothetical protein V6D08_00985 [Candidatus Obscuribacterales bacterium]